MDRADDGLLGLDRPALGLLGALFGFGDAALHLLEPPLARFFLCLQALQAFRVGGALFGGFGPLLDLLQPFLSFGHRALLRLAFGGELLLGALQIGGRCQRRGRPLGADRRTRRRLLLEALRRLQAAVGLGADALLLEADFLDLVANPLFRGDRVVLCRPGADSTTDRGRNRRDRRGQAGVGDGRHRGGRRTVDRLAGTGLGEGAFVGGPGGGEALLSHRRLVLLLAAAVLDAEELLLFRGRRHGRVGRGGGSADGCCGGGRTGCGGTRRGDSHRDGLAALLGGNTGLFAAFDFLATSKAFLVAGGALGVALTFALLTRGLGRAPTR